MPASQPELVVLGESCVDVVVVVVLPTLGPVGLVVVVVPGADELGVLAGWVVDVDPATVVVHLTPESVSDRPSGSTMLIGSFAA